MTINANNSQNSFVINHYKKERKSFVPMMYLMISVADIVNAIGLIYQSFTGALFVWQIISMDALRFNYAFSYAVTALSYR